MLNKIVIFYDNANFNKQIEYVFKYIFTHPLIVEQANQLIFNEDVEADLHIEYSNKKSIDNALYIPSQHIIFSDDYGNIDLIDTLVPNSYMYQDIKLYSVEDKMLESQIFNNDKNFNFDFIEMIFFHLSRYEEFFCPKEKLDKHERMRSPLQFLVKHKIQKIPVVDHVVYSFLNTINLFSLDTKTKIEITHDIDVIRRFPSVYRLLRAYTRIIVKDKSIKKFFKFTNQLVTFMSTKKDPYDTFDWLLSENEAYKKVIYFMSGGLTNYDNLYSIDDKKVENIISKALTNGYDIGLHPSYAAYENLTQFKKEKEKLEDVSNVEIIKSRQHILHFSFNKTLEVIHASGIKYDSTFGYQDLIGFRCGTGHPYYLYDIKNNNQISVKETPLVVMDGPLLMDSSYKIEKAKEELYNFLKENKNYTYITFNFHNSIFADLNLDSNGMKEFYLELNEYIKDKI